MIYHLDNYCPYFFFSDSVRISGVRQEDGKDVITSAVESHDGNDIVTHSKNTYILLSPSSELLGLYKKNRITINVSDPYASMIELREKLSAD